jgi:hypothetical protein
MISAKAMVAFGNRRNRKMTFRSDLSKESDMKASNREIKSARTSKRRPPLRKASSPITVAVRSMTEEETRQFDSALEFLLSETVRQHLGRTGEAS